MGLTPYARDQETPSGSRRSGAGRVPGPSGSADWERSGSSPGAGRRRPASRGLIRGLTVANDGLPYAGDGPRFATVSTKASRTTARFDFHLARRASVSLVDSRDGSGGCVGAALGRRGDDACASRTQSSVRDIERCTGRPRPPCNRAPTSRGSRRDAPGVPAETMHTVVRVLGVEAAFATRSALPGDHTMLVVRTDAKTLGVQMLRSGPETEPTYANNEIKGVAGGDRLDVDWTAHANAPAPLPLDIGADWPSGVYAARLDADDGRVGFAPIIVRPPAPRQGSPSRSRRAPGARTTSTMPTVTDGATRGTRVGRPGTPTWPGRTPRAACRIAIAATTSPSSTGSRRRGRPSTRMPTRTSSAFASPEALRASYDLIVFPGHTEYVSTRLYDLVEGFRDLGGNLLFLSANNFFRRVDRRDHVLTLIDEWRDLGRPEAALARQPVPRERPRPEARAVHRGRCRPGALGVRWNRIGQRLDLRSLRDRDRCARPGVTARDPGPGDDPGSLRAGPVRRDDLLRA